MRCLRHIAVVAFLLLAWCPPELQAQVCTCDNYGVELVYNGDFSQGNTGFTTDYAFSTVASPGRYGITTDPHTANFYWPSCPDHTSGSGNMMWVDAASSTSINIWTQTVSGLNTNKDYLFSCWLNTLDATAPGVLQFSVNGVLIGDSLVAPDSTCGWLLFCAIWNSGGNTSATITITNQSQFVYGNDVGIDDISFRECCHDTLQDSEVQICDGDSYQLPGGSWVSEEGSYADTLTTSLGCDSVIITHLTKLSTSASMQNVAICEGETYFAGGSNQTTGGYYLDTLANSVGCDSVLTTHLTVLPVSFMPMEAFICDGESYLAGGSWQTESGVYYDTLLNTAGCDSVIATSLTVLPSTSFTIEISICVGDSVFADGGYQTTEGIYVDTLTNMFGCDSIKITKVSLLAKSEHTQQVAVCTGESFFAGGAMQSSAGTYVDTLLNYLGCDSILTTILSLLPHTDSTRSVSICEGESFLAGGANQSFGGTYADTLANFLGCDSVLTTILTVLPKTYYAQDVSICDGESFYAGGNLQTSGGTYTDTLTNLFGCDSILTTVLSIMPLSYSAQSLSICNGDSVFLAGAYRKQEGAYYDTLLNYLGCDSILTTSLMIIPVSESSQSVFICQGESYFAGGGWQFFPGVYSDTLTNAAGCDSVVVTTIALLQATGSLQEVSLCNGQSFYCGGDEQTESGIYVDTLVNVAGCDSVLTTALTVLMNSVYSQSLSICTGDSVFAGGVWQDEPGVYTDHYLNAVGCDSTVITTLSLWPLFNTEVYVNICDGQNYFAGGYWHSQSGTYVDSLTAFTGCDSTVITYLTVLPPVITHIFPSICEGGNYLAGGSWQVGPGTYYDTLQSFAGCDSILITHLNVNPNPVVALGNDTSICEGTALLITGGDDYQSFYWQDESNASFFEASQEGVYWVVVTNTFGCSASDTMEIQQVYPLPEDFLSADTVICGNIPVTVSVSGYNKYEWFDGSASSSYTFTEEGTYSLLVTDDRGCKGSDDIHLENACNEDYLMPNAFSPNGDGLNDVFLPIPSHPFTAFDLRIFNRWGMLVFESDDLSQGWDGREKGAMGEIGTYVWNMEYTLEDGTMKSASGSVVLLR